MFRLILILLLLFSFSCSANILERPSSVVPVCLFSAEMSETKIAKAANKWNERLNKNVVQAFPNCDNNAQLVQVIQTVSYPIQCSLKQEYKACTKRITTLSGVLMSVEIFIVYSASFDVLMHEIGHLVGCKHDDYLPPCWE